MKKKMIVFLISVAVMLFIFSSTAFAMQNGSVGMQGFEGEYALGEPEEIVEIIVQFRTPPAVALRLIQEREPIRVFSEDTFEEQALAAHTEFHAQLNQFPIPLSDAPVIEIFGEHHRLFNGVYMRVPAGIVEMIAELPEVFGVFPNVTFYPMNAPAPEINFMREAREYLGIDYINNNLGITGNGVRVGILDSGIEHDHPEFKRFQSPETGLIRGGERSCNAASTDPYDIARAHGTTVSGAVIGIAPNIELWHYRLDLHEAGGGLSPIAAVEAAHEDEMQVMNLSFGAFIHHPFDPLNTVINLAVMDGIVVAVAAGNLDIHWGTREDFTINTPGTAPLAITVGAGNAGHDYPCFSDSLREYSARGPIERTFHIKPDIIVTTGVTVPTVGGGYASGQGGTSHAAPIIAGLAALILEQNPNACPGEVKARILNTARPMLEVNPSNVFSVGAGFAQPFEALTQEAFATVEHPVPVMGEQNVPLETSTMASLSFGHVFNSAQMTVTIHNAGAETWVPQISFNGNHDGVEFTVEPSGENTFTAWISFASDAAHRLYQGNIIFTNGAGKITMPFAARYSGELADITDRFECANFLALVREIINVPYPQRVYRHVVSTIETLYGSERDITSLAGIEYFSELTTLYVGNNNFTEIDLSANTSLLTLYVGNNNLTEIDISANTALRNIFIYNNNLTTIDVSDISNLLTLDVHMNKMTYPNDVIGWQKHFQSVGNQFRYFPQRPTSAIPRTITGFVDSGNGNGLVGAHVTLVDMETGVRTAVTTTNAMGFYNFTNIPDGTYRIVTTMNVRWASISDAVVMNNDFHMVNLTNSGSGGITPRALLVRLTGLSNQNPPGTDVRIGTTRFTAPAVNATDNFWRIHGFNPVGIGTVTATSPGFLSSYIDVTADDYINNLAIISLHLVEDKPFILGDANGDGRVTSADATTIAKHLAGHDVDICLLAADINGDGEVDIEDLILLARMLVGR
ncbi:MAG: S8 family serine peptidase [Defluviitaleaceae bacterium]|nr:S8 family serine peptidase [Defluviitaleaceae bacterium]